MKEEKQSILNTLPTIVRTTIDRHTLLHPGETILAAVSGGIDSMVMLHVLKQFGYAVEAVHFDHQSRGGESGKDADFVKDICEKWGVVCHFGTEPVEKNASKSGMSFEQYARTRRYAFLLNTATENGIDVIATGHQQDDQAETVLMGILGLASGIGPGGYALATVQDGIRIVRPLADCSRNMLVAWAQAHQLAWREDGTNGLPICVRNRIRHDVLPALKRIAPDVGHQLVQLGEIYRTSTEFLDRCSADLLDETLRADREDCRVRILDRERFIAAPTALRRHLIKVLAHRNNVNMTYEHSARAESFILHASSGNYFDFGKGMRLYVARDGIHLAPEADVYCHDPEITVTLVVPGETMVGQYRIQARIAPHKAISLEDIRKNSCSGVQYFDLDVLEAPVEVRFRRSGDTLVPYGMTVPKKLQELMISCGIPGYRRNTVPLVTVNDHIIWAVGCRRSAHAPVLETTAQVLELVCIPLENGSQE